jgi:hypothetical protein
MNQAQHITIMSDRKYRSAKSNENMAKMTSAIQEMLQSLVM